MSMFPNSKEAFRIQRNPKACLRGVSCCLSFSLHVVTFNCFSLFISLFFIKDQILKVRTNSGHITAQKIFFFADSQSFFIGFPLYLPSYFQMFLLPSYTGFFLLYLEIILLVSLLQQRKLCLQVKSIMLTTEVFYWLEIFCAFIFWYVSFPNLILVFYFA
jgi:hypothetical protein